MNANFRYETYTVVRGDTLWRIAKKFRVTVDWLKKINHLQNDIISENEVLIVHNIQKTNLSIPSKLIFHGKRSKKMIALTMDAGAPLGLIDELLQVLKKHEVTSTFFLTGQWVVQYESYAKSIAAHGHEIGNHSYDHPDFRTLEAHDMITQILQCEMILYALTGKQTVPIFRAPYGAYNDTVLKVAGELGYHYTIQWSLDTIDWKQPPAEQIVNRIKKNIKSGDIILTHVGGLQTPAALDLVIPALKKQGYRFVTVSEMLNLKPVVR